MRISLTAFVSLDGVSQGPGSPSEDTTDGFARGGWLVLYVDGHFVQKASEWLDLADGLLFGRRTYEAFTRDWPQITDPEDPFTERMNGLPKYVVTSTLTERGLEPDDGAARRPAPDRRRTQGEGGPRAPDPRECAARQVPAGGRSRRRRPARRGAYRHRFRTAPA